uniref:Uncharacterized protein n=1 Tax=Anguilla anguilla TaxID=7936 RepID=A0A0E9W2C0_ANGAN
MLSPGGGTSTTICCVIPVDSCHWQYRILNNWTLHC